MTGGEKTFNAYRIINDVGVRGSEYSSGSGWLGNSA